LNNTESSNNEVLNKSSLVPSSVELSHNNNGIVHYNNDEILKLHNNYISTIQVDIDTNILTDRMILTTETDLEKLKREHQENITRLMAKLSNEQRDRLDLQDTIESLQQKLNDKENNLNERNNIEDKQDNIEAVVEIKEVKSSRMPSFSFMPNRERTASFFFTRERTASTASTFTDGVNSNNTLNPVAISNPSEGNDAKENTNSNLRRRSMGGLFSMFGEKARDASQSIANNLTLTHSRPNSNK
jgi:hypothetical protein